MRDLNGARSLLRRVLRVAANLFLFLAMLVATAVLVGRVQPFAHVPYVRERLAHFETHADVYDTLFFGSSRVYRGIAPVVFDQLTAEAGVPTRSFNFGIGGMFSPEDAYVLEALLAVRPRQLRRVFIEISFFMQEFEERDAGTVRSIHWHDWKRTCLVSSALLSSKSGKIKWKRWLPPRNEERKRFDQLLTHWRLFSIRGLNLGRGSEALGRMLGIPNATPRGALGDRRDGFKSYGNVRRATGLVRAQFEKALVLRRAQPARISLLAPAPQRSLDGMIAAVRQAGAEPILVIAPTLNAAKLHPREDSGAPLLDFSDVARWPELFDPDERIDMDHLTQEGSERFTRALATQFIELARRDDRINGASERSPAQP